MPSKLGNWNRLREVRIGIMLHYDESTSDAGALEWLMYDERCKVSYTWIVLDDGTVVDVAPWNARAWHAGTCKPSNTKQLKYSDANSAFYGIAIAAGSKDTVTEAQLKSVIRLCRALFEKHGWSKTDGWRIVGHEDEAWERGRKIDPTGPNKSKPVMSVQAVRDALLQNS